MKVLLAIVPLAFCSCATTTSNYGGEREFPVEATALEVDIDYSNELCAGSARTTTFLFLFRFGPSDFSYSGPNGAPGAGGMIAFSSGASGTESAAVNDALSKTGGHVLGFPMFRKKVTNYFLWSFEDVWVEGFSGEVLHSGMKL